MKRCPECRRDYFDDSLLYCLDDGAGLLEGPAMQSNGEPRTAVLREDRFRGELPTKALVETPDAHKSADPAVRSARRFPTQPIAVAVATAILVAGGLVAYHYLRADPAQINSIAVMPFAGGGGDADVDYLADGMAETLVNSLSKVPGLNVKAWSSVFRYKGQEIDAKTIGDQLGVEAVLKGRIMQSGDRLSVDLELINAQTENVVWADKYDRSQSDLVVLQNEIVSDVASKLRTKLSGDIVAKVEKKYTADPEAYQFYLRGQYEWHKHTQDAVRKAIDDYDHALEKDPNYALAYFGLSASYGVLGNNYVAPKEAFPLADAYAAKGLALDPASSEAHSASGAVKLYYDWDWAGAEHELKLAQTLDPNNVESHNLYSDYLDAMGRLDESMAERRRTQEMDLLAPMYGIVLGDTLYFQRKYDEAIAQFDRSIMLEPHISEAYLYRGQALEQEKLFPRAIESLQNGINQAEPSPSLVAELGHAYGLSGDSPRAKIELDELNEMSRHVYVSPYFFAIVYLGSGDKERCLAMLEKAFQDRSAALIWLNVEPTFDPLRADPRFKDLVRRMNLPA